MHGFAIKQDVRIKSGTHAGKDGFVVDIQGEEVVVQLKDSRWVHLLPEAVEALITAPLVEVTVIRAEAKAEPVYRNVNGYSEATEDAATEVFQRDGFMTADELKALARDRPRFFGAEASGGFWSGPDRTHYYRAHDGERRGYGLIRITEKVIKTSPRTEPAS